MHCLPKPVLAAFSLLLSTTNAEEPKKRGKVIVRLLGRTSLSVHPDTKHCGKGKA
jgi:hypothetical protein